MQILEQDLPVIKSWLKALAEGKAEDVSQLQEMYDMTPAQSERIRLTLQAYGSIDEQGKPTPKLADQLRTSFYHKQFRGQEVRQAELVEKFQRRRRPRRPRPSLNTWIWIAIFIACILLAIAQLAR